MRHGARRSRGGCLKRRRGRRARGWNRISWGGSSGGYLVEGNALVGAMVLRQAQDAFGDGVEQGLVRSAGDAAGRGVDPARRPVILGRGVRVKGETGGALKVDGQIGRATVCTPVTNAQLACRS